MGARPAGGSIVKTAVHAEAGITEWTLSNGVRVVLQPTTFKQDEILLRAFSPAARRSRAIRTSSRRRLQARSLPKAGWAR
jgi:hypothetical protein